MSIELAEECIEAKEWKEALAILEGLKEKAATDGERERLGLLLSQIGDGWLRDSEPAEAMRALEQALGLFRHIHAAGDHPNVAGTLNSIARCLRAMGRFADALSKYEEALAMLERLHAPGDHPDIATILNNVGVCLRSLGRDGEALQRCEAALAMRRRAFGRGDHPDVLQSLTNLASCLDSLGRPGEALTHHEEALAMAKRLHGERDHPDVTRAVNNLAACLQASGRADDALAYYGESLAMAKRMHGDRDHAEVAASLNNLGACLVALGRADEALVHLEESLASRRRLYGNRDHPEVATSLHNLGVCAKARGRLGDALLHFEESLASRRRLYGNRDHPQIATSLRYTGLCLQDIGRTAEALPRLEASVAMSQRLRKGVDHPDVSRGLSALAECLMALGRPADALTRFEESFSMMKRMLGDADHPDLAAGMNNLGRCLYVLDRASEAVKHHEMSLAMKTRLHADHDHSGLAEGMNNLAACLLSIGRVAEARPRFEAALAMMRRLHGTRDHTVVSSLLNNTAFCLETLGRPAEALPRFEESLAMMRRLFGDCDHANVVGSLCNQAACLESLGRQESALACLQQACDMAEHLRDHSRLSVDLQQSHFDELKRGAAFERLQAVAKAHDAVLALSAAERSRGRGLLDLLAQQTFDPLAEAFHRVSNHRDVELPTRISKLCDEVDQTRLDSDRLLHQLTQLDDAKLTNDERDTKRATLLVESNAVATKLRQLLDERAQVIADVLPVGRVRSADEIRSVLRENEMFLEFTVTDDVALLYLLDEDGLDIVDLPTAHAAAHRLLPALLQSASRDQLRGRDPDARTSSSAERNDGARELFASLFPAAVWTKVRGKKRVFVAAHRELHRLPFELLVVDTKDGKPVHWLDAGPELAYVPSGSALHWLRKREPAAKAALDLVAVGDPTLDPTQPDLGPSADAARFVHQDDLERIRKLARLKGAEAEAKAIAAAFGAKDRKTELLLADEATEPAITELASKAKYLHFACHGIAEEYAGQSLSMLVLAQPKDVLPGNDGFLKLGDLLHAWRGRLASTRLVVLSACRTNVGPTLRDEAPQALPLGFLFAGAPAVISSLWAVDDASTKELMTDFYGRLLAGETDELAAFTAAKKALRAKYPDPFHWAPFLYVGSPD